MGATENELNPTLNHLMLSTTEAWARFCNKPAQIIAKTSTSLQLSVSGMLT